MARFGNIPTDLDIANGEVPARKADGSGWESVAPGAGSTIETLVSDSTELDSLITLANANTSNRYNAILDTTATISAAKTIPANVFFQSLNGTKFTKSGSGSITFEGVGITGDHQHQIFNGFAAGDVTWTGAVPPAFYPEWFGAVGDGTTDDLVAFDSLTFAVPDAVASGDSSVKVLLNPAKNYKLSDSWHIDCKMRVESDSSTLGARITWPTNTIGIIAHYTHTKTGSDNGRFQYRSQFRNLHLSGGLSYQQSTPSTHTVNVSAGFTVTKTAGDDFVVANGYAVGNTIHINGYPYVIDAVSSTTVLTIREPVLVVLGTNGSAVMETIAGVNLPTTEWDGVAIEIGGTEYIIDSISGDTITLTTNFTGTTGYQDAHLVDGLNNMTGVDARVNRFHGFDIRGPVIIENCRVTGFAGNGISLGNSLTQGAPGGVSPNSNLSRIIGNESTFNAGSGFVTAGQNAAQCTFINNDCTGNGGYGYLEMGGSGNNYISNHSSFNFSGSTYVIQNGINQSVFIGEYTEGGSVSSTFADDNSIIGGTPGAGLSKYNDGGTLRTEGGIMSLTNLRITRPVSSSNAKMWSYGIGDVAYSSHIASFGAAEEDANIYAAGSATNFQFPAYWFWYDPWGYAGWYIWHYKANNLGSMDTPVYGVSGSEASEGGGKFAFFNGFRTGKTDPHVSRILTATATLNFSSIAAGTTAEMTIAVSGVLVAETQAVTVTPENGIEAGLVWSGYVSDDGEVTVRLANVTTGAIDPASITWRATVMKFA